MPGMSSNQYFPALPSLGGGNRPRPLDSLGGSDPSLGPVVSGYNPATNPGGPNNPFDILGTMDPNLTSRFFDFLNQMMGQGGGGQELFSKLMSFFSTGKGGPTGTDTLAQMSATGMPINVTPEWQAMLDAQKRNIGQNEANLREQFAFGGDLKSSPFGQSMTDYMTQTTKDQNALLGQLTAQAGEAAKGRQLGASEFTQDQAQKMMQNLYNMIFGASTTFQPAVDPSKGIGLAGGAAEGFTSMLPFLLLAAAG